MIHEGEIIDVSTAARLLGLHEETLRRMARNGQIPAFKVGRGWRFNRSTLHEWAEAQRRPETRKRVLVIDDQELDLELIGVAVEEAGFTVVTANSGAKALDIMRQELPDIVLLDLKMPGMDGPTVLSEIRKAYGSIPVILITGYPDSDLVSKALDFGPVTLLAKPVNPQQLASTAQMALNGRE
jgi:excisionase family DNA binding protein